MAALPARAEAPSQADAAPQPPAQQAEIPKIAPNATEFMLSNGMEVVVIPDRRAPVVTHMVWYRVGSADETAGESGLAHFLEHLMFKGTREHPMGQFSERVSRIGGEENAFTTTDYTAYFQRVAKENLREMMGFEADRMTNLVLTEEVVAPERDVILEERRMRVENDPSSLLSEALNRVLYLNHPYGRPVIGWMHEIKALTGAKALAFYNRYYTPNNAVLVVAGDVTPEEVRSLAEETYGKVPARPEAVRAPRPVEPPPVGARTVTVQDEKVREPQLTRAYIVPSQATADGDEAEALRVLSEVLGGGATSRLYDELVRGDGPATYAGAYYQSNAVDDGRFVVYGVPKDGVNLEDLGARIETVIARIRENGVTEAELTRAKNATIAQAIYAQDSQQALARIIGTALMTGSTLKDVQNWPARVNAVTAEEVRDVARKYLREDRSATGYLEPLPPRAEAATARPAERS
ncbi:insulinase family protein [Rhizobiales bacterium L72]|uniref:Insulinase family protein n=2 Tax=Propylenella binzhouense TaxID=2555902 RepID=A0A964T216_9HYPH|nr:insulinase family protein [Propylenella binzhouense]